MIAKIIQTIKSNLFLIILIILISLLSFQLGRISKINFKPIRIEEGGIKEIFNKENGQSTQPETRNLKVNFKVVASRNSNLYHFPWCPGAKRIKEENKIWFNSEEEAIKSGYTLAKNCSK